MTVHELVLGASETFCENCRPTGGPCPVLVVVSAARAYVGSPDLEDWDPLYDALHDAVRALDGEAGQ